MRGRCSASPAVLAALLLAPAGELLELERRAPEGLAELAADPITAGEIREHVDVLASDALEGREAGTRGERLAARYIAETLSEIEGIVPGGDDGGWEQPFEVSYDGKLHEARNVIGVLPGTDPELFHEVIVVGAHYDHVGYGRHGNTLGEPGEIHNGADDNASGTAAVLEVAEALATRPGGTRRTFCFQFYSAEELGLLGSAHYVEHPRLPLEDTIAMFNLDMIGRVRGRTVLVGGTGTSPGFSGLVHAIADEVGLALVEHPTGTAPSDNANFYRRDVPALLLFSGIHEDYHRPGDDPDELNAEGARLAAELTLRVVAALDAADERPPFTEATGEMPYWLPRPYLGVVLTSSERGAALVTSVDPDSPAERAGLRAGDVILALDGRELASFPGLDAAVAAADPDAEHALTVLRDGEDAPRTLPVRLAVR